MAKKDLDIVKEDAVIERNTPIIDVNLEATEKKPIRINGDNTKVIYLNLSDLNIVKRFNEVYPKLKELESKVSALELDDTEDFMEHFSSTLSEIDESMREHVNYIFDTDVCSVCVGRGSMYDPFNGRLRYEYIIEALSKLYETNFNAEFKHMQARVNKHVSKYHN